MEGGKLKNIVIIILLLLNLCLLLLVGFMTVGFIFFGLDRLGKKRTLQENNNI